MGRKVMIVFEEADVAHVTGSDVARGFNVYLEGDTPPDNTPEDQLSTAQWWALKMFRIVVHYLQQSGAVKTISEKGKN